MPNDLIHPRTLKGFRDYLPEAMIPREGIVDTAKRVYRSFGFAPIDTPALEYLEILTGKGSDETDKQLYRFEDHGGRRVGLRFDLTVPLARFAAQHAGQLGLPFKRYQIASVWRGENTQRGRYREFMQCDFDTVGTTAVVADIEAVVVVHDLLRAIGFGATGADGPPGAQPDGGGFTIRLNNRAVLTGLLEKAGLAGQATGVLRALDKLAKIGPDKVADELRSSAGATTRQADEVLRLVQLGGDNASLLDQVDSLVAGSGVGEAGAARLREVFAGAAAAGVDPARVRLDVSIARGLDYYTGLVLETFLDELPEIGSVASGGRYDNLAGLYTKQLLPGIGASLGLDRLLAAMETLKLLPASKTPAPVFIPYFAADRLGDYLKLAAAFRAAGFGVELYPEPKKLGKQLQYADKKGFRLALIAGPDEFQAGVCQVKDLATGESKQVPIAESPSAVKEALAACGNRRTPAAGP
ncbi:MAG: histidine--tRNA ligase [Planctomycetota bacterium]